MTNVKNYIMPSALIAIGAMLVAAGTGGLQGAVGLEPHESNAFVSAGCGPDDQATSPQGFAASLEEAACAYAANPLNFDNVIVGSGRGATVAYGAPFGVGYTVSLGPDALLPVQVHVNGVKVSSVGLNDAGDELCADISLDVEVKTQPGQGASVDPDAATLYPDYFDDVVRPLGMNFPSSLSIEVTGNAPTAAAYGEYPIIKCNIKAIIRGSHAATPVTTIVDAPLTALVPSSVEVPLGQCTGFEGSADCNVDTVLDLDDAANPTLTLVGASENLTVTGTGTYSWENLDAGDEDYATIFIQAAGADIAETTPAYTAGGLLVAPGYKIDSGSRVPFCLGMTVHDVDQWWDLNGEQLLDSSSFCIAIEYIQDPNSVMHLGACEPLAQQALDPGATPTVQALAQCLAVDGVISSAQAILAPFDDRMQGYFVIELS